MFHKILSTKYSVKVGLSLPYHIPNEQWPKPWLFAVYGDYTTQLYFGIIS